MDNVTVRKKELESMNILAFLSGFSAHLSEDLNKNNMYRHNFKKWGSKLFKTFADLEDNIYNCEGKKKNAQQFYEEMSKSFIAVENIIRCSMNIKNDNQRQYYIDDLDKLFKKHNLY